MAEGAGGIIVDGGMGFVVAAVVRPQRPLGWIYCSGIEGVRHMVILGDVYCLRCVLFSSLAW